VKWLLVSRCLLTTASHGGLQDIQVVG